jgi:hypothetical protein
MNHLIQAHFNMDYLVEFRNHFRNSNDTLKFDSMKIYVCECACVFYNLELIFTTYIADVF